MFSRPSVRRQTAPVSHLLHSRPSLQRRTVANSLPRPPPSTAPPAETFSSPSKPRQYYHRPPPRDLPPYRRAWPMLLALSSAGVGVWVAFLQYSANQERLASSSTRAVLAAIKDSPEVREVLGDAVRPEPAWYLNGDPWVSGSVKMHQGFVDLSFRVKGHKDSGTLYYTTIRKSKGERFTPIRFKIIADSGPVIHLPPP
ncbi:hypothetical protein BV25DRAFT_1836859 [Artomyces pyxidatus]|uniref:Uncharacterized protein n=1 Tax=Artomyces pyxidatus TaxID=48021 RepID=A0ACB8T6Y6_9AGAM|nr:hypothetical protein BV25DRAFT_1836859 [Artomyces pyxidatus]